jgi:hypothetical protein
MEQAANQVSGTVMPWQRVLHPRLQLEKKGRWILVDDLD